jgi:Domain of unknown function (DUF4375)
MITRDECLRIAEQIADKWGPIADARGPLFVPIESRTVLQVSCVGAVIDNGGFEYLVECAWWEGDEDLLHAITAFRRIDCEEAANVISFVISHFLLQDGSSSLDTDERLSALNAAFPEESRTELAGRFWSEREQIQAKLAAYVFANKAQIDQQLQINLKTYPPLSQ